MKLYIQTFIVSLCFVLAFGIWITPKYQAQAHGGENNECEDSAAINVGADSDDYATYQAESGKTISGVCIKAGNTPFGDGHSDQFTSDGLYECYNITGIGTNQVDVTRNGEGRECQGISHIDVYTQLASSTPTQTPTQTPTPTESLQNTPTPTDTQNSITPTPTVFECEDGTDTCIIIDCPGGGDCEVVIGSPSPTKTPTQTPSSTVTETPTVTPAATHTPTPTDTQDNNDNNDNNDDSSDNQPAVGGTDISGGQVLGASTLAQTGTFTESASNLLLLVGVAFLGIALTLRLQKR